MFFLHTVISRILVLAIPVLFYSACIDDGPLERDESASLTVSIAATPSILTEVQQTPLTLTIRLSEAPTEGGLNVGIDSETPNALDQFDFSAAVYNGAMLTLVNADSSGFTLNVTEQTATVILPTFVDDLAEASETFTYSLEPSAAYTIDPEASRFSVTISDMPPDVLTIGITAAPTELIETEQTVLTLTIGLSETPPAAGVDVTIDSDIPGSLAEFDVFAAGFNGATLVTANADSSGFTLNVFEQTATVSLPVFNDGVSEGPETLTYALEPSADYAIDPAASSVSVTLFDMAL